MECRLVSYLQDPTGQVPTSAVHVATIVLSRGILSTLNSGTWFKGK